MVIMAVMSESLPTSLVLFDKVFVSCFLLLVSKKSKNYNLVIVGKCIAPPLATLPLITPCDRGSVGDNLQPSAANRA